MKEAGALGSRIFREATRIDPSAIELGFAIRSTAAVAIVVIAGTLAHAPLAAAAGAFGTFVVGTASRQGIYRTRATAMLVTSLVIAITAFAASLTHANPVASIILAAVIGFAYGIVASLGMTATTIAVNAAVSLAIFGSFSLTVGQAAEQSAFVFAGGLLQTTLLVVLWPFERFANERAVLASAFRALAAYGRSFPGIHLTAPAPDTFVKLSDVFTDMQPFARRGDIAAFQTLFEETERIRGSLAALATEKFLLDRRGDHAAVTAVADAGVATADIVAEIAAALASARAPYLHEPWLAFDKPLATLESRTDTIAVRSHSDLEGLLGQLRAAWRAAYVPSGEIPPDPSTTEKTRTYTPHAYPTSEFSEALATLRANLSPRSEYARHGMRLAIVLATAVLFERLLPFQHAYWVVLTAALVLRPDFGATFSRGVARMGGTLAGAIVASLVLLAHPGGYALAALTIIFAFASYIFLPVNYGLFTLTITAYVVFILGVGGTHPGKTVVDRVVATLIGGSLSLVAYAAWPTWERRLLPRRFAEYVEALDAYGAAITRAYREPAAEDGTFHHLQLGAWLARSNAESSFDRMSSEPVKPDALTVRAALGILAALRRYGLALLSLNVHRPKRPIAAAPAFRALTDACNAALKIVSRSLRTRRVPAKMPPLRELHGQFLRDVGDDMDVDASVAAAETDLMVDALNTMARLLERRFGASRT